MKALRLGLVVLGLGLLCAFGCGGRNQEPDPNGESHWLTACATDAECAGAGSCLCGTCTLACQRDDQCITGSKRTTCIAEPSCQLSAGSGRCLQAPVDAGSADVSVDAPAGDTGGGDVSVDAPAADAAHDADACGIPPCPPPGLFDPDTCTCVAVDATGTASTWVNDLMAAYCTWAIRCGQFQDAAACEAYMRPQFDVTNFNSPSAAISAVLDGKAQFDPAQAASCLTTLANLGCDTDFTRPPNFLVPAACMAVFSGSVSNGGTCIDDVECANGSMCIVTSTVTCKGTCQPASGGACRMDADCPAQQYCAAASMQGPGFWGSGVCEAIVPPGATEGALCGRPMQCASGLYCIGGPAPAVCGKGAQHGESCGGFNGPSCAPGLACASSDDGKTKTCTPPAKLGEACTSLYQCGAQYVLSDIICDQAVTHTCVHRPSTGPCSAANNTCDPVTSYCDEAAAACKPSLPRGAACVFPPSGINPCGLWNSCRNSVCLAVLGVCTP